MAAAPIPWNLANDPIDWDVIGINWDTAAKSESCLLYTSDAADE